MGASIGKVVSLWRYPVKSMIGEELNATKVAERGLLGDRAYALMDLKTGNVVSAKNPRRWSQLFNFRATFVAPPDGKIPPVEITLPDGTTVLSNAEDVNKMLSEVLGREVTLETAAPTQPSLEEYWPDIDGLPHREAVTDEATLANTFFDLATVHLLTTATLNRLRELSPSGQFEARRFRPNLLIEPSSDNEFAENNWVGQTLAIGEVRLQVTGLCPRCVMTTLPQENLPKDLNILQTVVQHNQGNAGIYASVLKEGTIRQGDAVSLE